MARNLRTHRLLLGLSQADLGGRMRALGYGTWSQQTVGELERGRRSLNVDELAGLSMALEATIASLLDPLGPLRQYPNPEAVDCGTRSPVAAEMASRWARSEVVPTWSHPDSKKRPVAVFREAT